MHGGRRASSYLRQTGSASNGTKAGVEALWDNYFKNPIDWWDNRTNRDQAHLKSPDFRHKVTKEALWIDSWSTPEWVTQTLKRKTSSTTAAGGSFQSGSSSNGEGRPENAVGLKSSQRNENSWTILMWQHAKYGQGRQALRIYEEMLRGRLKPSTSTFLALLKACSSLQDLETAKRIHADVVRSCLESDLYVGTMLVDVYIKCRSLVDARYVFDHMPRRDVVSWTAMIFGYAQADKGEEALHLCTQMQLQGIVPNARTYVSALKACSALAESGEKKQKCLDTVRSLHSEVLKAQLESDLFVGNMLVDAYGKCGSLKDARQVFEELPRRDVVSWNAMIMGYTQNDKGEEALTLYTRMAHDGVVPNGRTFVTALKACSTLAESGVKDERCLKSVRCIHAHVLKAQFESDLIMGNMLIDLYAKCRCLEDARSVFEKLPCRDVVSWNTMISGYAHMDKGGEALQLYTRMQQEGLVPNDRTFVSALKACSSLFKACSAIAESGKQKKGDGVAVRERCRDTIRAIHTEVVKGKLELDVFVGTMLVDVYAKYGDLEDARQVFEKMPHRDVVSWNAMILGYAKMDKGEEALHLYTQMKSRGMIPDDRTFVCILMACTSLATLDDGNGGDGKPAKKRCLEIVRAVHTDVREGKFEFDVFVANMLVDAYAKCGNLMDARNVFDKMPCRNVVSWTAMILGYAEMDRGEEALELYTLMQEQGVSPDCRTYMSALKACSSLAEREQKKEAACVAVTERCLNTVRSIHTDIVNAKLQSDVFVGNMLVDAYATCGSLHNARCVFEQMPHRDVVSWTAMIFGYAQMDKGGDALHLYTQMQEQGVVPDARTYLSALKACSSLAESGDRNEGDAIAVKERCLGTVRAIHADVVKRKFEMNVFVGTMLVDVYAKCGSLKDARHVFEMMPHRSVVSWTAMMFGYVQIDEGEVALQLYAQMQQEGVLPNKWTFVSALNACGSLAELEMGKEIHAQIVTAGLEATDSFVTHSLIDMYGKCGSMVDAQQVFDAMPVREIVAWNVLIAGYAHQGESEVVFDLIHRMEQENIQPNSITFLGLLTVCSHVGLVDRGQMYFEVMSRDYGIMPSIRHFSCMIDLLGRAGHLEKAMDMAKSMPFQPNSAVWRCMLGACQKWGNVPLGREAFECALELDKEDAAAYVMMSNIYGAAHMGDEAKEMQAMRVKSGAWKQPGRTRLTYMGGTAHVFEVGNPGHP